MGGSAGDMKDGDGENVGKKRYVGSRNQHSLSANVGLSRQLAAKP